MKMLPGAHSFMNRCGTNQISLERDDLWVIFKLNKSDKATQENVDKSKKIKTCTHKATPTLVALH